MAGGESTRKYTLFVVLVLKNKSDADNPLTVTEIQDHINSTYMGGHAIAHEVDRSSDKNGMINAIVDMFGCNTKMRPANDDELKEAFAGKQVHTLPDEEWIHAEVQGTFGGLVLFATEYCQNVRILSPDDVIKETEKRLKEALCLYGQS